MLSFFRSIHGKIIFWTLLPTLATIAGLTLIFALTVKNTALDVAVKTEVELADIAAKRLSENLYKYPLFLKNLVEKDEFKNKQFKSMNTILQANNNLLHIFDGGIHFFNDHSEHHWSYPEESWSEGTFFPDRQSFDQIRETLRPVYSNIMKRELDDSGYIIIAVPVIGTNNRFAGILAGICSLNRSTIGTTYSRVLEYESGESNYAYLVDGNANVLYHRRSSQIGSQINDPGTVKSVIAGFVGARATKNITGETVISGYAPVPETDWGVVTQSDWSHIQNLITFYSRLSLFLLWGAGLISALAVFYFIQKLLGPVRALTEGAEQIANGDFIEIPVTKSNDEIEVLTKQFNSMARTVKASFSATEKRITLLNQARMDLSRSEKQISGIINAVKDIMMMVDHTGEILWINDKGKRIFGEDAETKSYQEVIYSEQDYPDDCIVQNFFLNNQENDTELEIYVNGQFQHYWCSANGVHWDHRQDKSKQVVIVCRNLTEKKQLREEVLRNAQLAALGELAAGIAHEINNPINGIINYAQIVEDKWDRDEHHRHAQVPSKIIKEAERVALIVSKLLSFARVDSEKKVAVDIGEIISDSLDLTGAVLRKDLISVSLDIPERLPRSKGVTHQLQQIFLNLLGNARYALNLKYPIGNPDKTITIHCREVVIDERKMLRTTFKDNGTGIAKNIVQKVCNPFFSTKPPSEGTGLGLSISYGIIEEHDGELSVTSSPDNWTEVVIDLPLWKQQ